MKSEDFRAAYDSVLPDEQTKEKILVNILTEASKQPSERITHIMKSKMPKTLPIWIAVAACFILIIAGSYILSNHVQPILPPEETNYSSPSTTEGAFVDNHTQAPFPVSLAMTVYAADASMHELGPNPTTIYNSLTPDKGFTSFYDYGNGKGRESFVFNVTCDRNDVESITYVISGEEAAQSVLEMDYNHAWFSTQKLSSDRVEQEFPIYATRRSPEGTYVYSYIGNSITIDKDNQNESGIILEYWVDYNGEHWDADAISINVNILLKDGTAIEKEMIVSPIFSAEFHEILITLNE